MAIATKYQPDLPWGDNVRQAREGLGLSREQLAGELTYLLECPTSSGTVELWETGKDKDGRSHLPTIRRLRAVCDRFGWEAGFVIEHIRWSVNTPSDLRVLTEGVPLPTGG